MGNMRSAFSQSFRLPPPPITEKNIADQSGRVIIVTGSNTGVGYHVARILYQANATVYIAARTESKALSAIESIKSSQPSSHGSLHFLKLDLSDLTTIKASAQEFLGKEERLDVLINNAGVMVPPANSRSPQGHELQYATNILGPFMFTKLLLPILSETAKTAPKNSVRVSWAGSLVVDVGSPKGGVTFTEDGSLYDFKTGGSTAYAASKAANFFLGYEFGRRSGIKDGVLHNSFNPGNLASDLQRHARDRFGAATFKVLDTMLYPPVFGAYTELYAGFSPDLSIAQNQGGYIWPWGRIASPRKDVAAECKADGTGKSELLWNWCERETGKFL